MKEAPPDYQNARNEFQRRASNTEVDSDPTWPPLGENVAGTPIHTECGPITGETL